MGHDVPETRVIASDGEEDEIDAARLGLDKLLELHDTFGRPLHRIRTLTIEVLRLGT